MPKEPELRRLRDVVVHRPKLLLVGINPGLRSSSEGHHFAGNGNPFWRLLHAARIVREPLTYHEDQKLALEGIALTNLCPRPTRSAAELTRRNRRRPPNARAQDREARAASRVLRRLEPVPGLLSASEERRCRTETRNDRGRAGVRRPEPERPERQLPRASRRSWCGSKRCTSS